jgi:hypothetical protein
MHDLESKRLGAIPTAAGLVTRLAYDRAQAAGIELEPLLKPGNVSKISGEGKIELRARLAKSRCEQHIEAPG